MLRCVTQFSFFVMCVSTLYKLKGCKVSWTHGLLFLWLIEMIATLTLHIWEVNEADKHPIFHFSDLLQSKVQPLILFRRILSDFNFVYFNVRMFVLTESYISNFAKSRDLNLNSREREVSQVRCSKWVFIVLYTVNIIGYVWIIIIVRGNFYNSSHKEVEVFAWYNFVFSWILLHLLVSIHLYMFKQWYKMQRDLRHEGTIHGSFYQRYAGEMMMAIAYSFFFGYLIYEYILSPTIYLLALFIDWYTKDAYNT